eukprot:Sspe_Gene.115343::Locus_102480_Transcript_1_1_Confidence_1.000_Length_992::g.115343::m.115343
MSKVKRTPAVGQCDLDYTFEPSEVAKGMDEALRGDGEAAVQGMSRCNVLGHSLEAEVHYLRDVVGVLCNELSREVQERNKVVSQYTKFNSIMSHFRQDTDLTYSYKQRIRQLEQQLASSMTHDGLPNPRTGATGFSVEIPIPNSPLPQDPHPVVSELTAITNTLKERADQLQADALKLRSDKFALLGDKGLLLKRIRQLETKVIATNHANAHYRRAAAKKATIPPRSEGGTPRPPTRPPSGRLLNVGGVEMEPEVVAWLKEMYAALSAEEKAEPPKAAVSDSTSTQTSKGESTFAKFVQESRERKGRGQAAKP